MSDFIVKTQKFEGPIELLLELIEERRLDINEVSLAEVAESFIEHVKAMEELPIAHTANFILIASTLLLIKSMSLLPGFELTQEEKQSVDELKERLQIYRDTKAKSRHIAERFGKNIIFEREGTEAQMIFAPPADLGLLSILSAIKAVIHNLPKKEFIPRAIVRKVVSLEEMIINLAERIKKQLKMKFSEFSGRGKAEKIKVIVSFLAMLELVKQGAILVRQHSHFTDIDIESQEPSVVPDYS